MRLDDEASHICPHAGRGRPGTVARILSRRTRIADRGDALQSGPRCLGCRGGSKGIFMRLVRLRAPGGLGNLKLVEEDHPKPRPGELLVRIRAGSLNFHDDLVVLGKIPRADGRIPMSDGAGEVIAVGDDVDEFKVADTVVSTFWPYWLGGEMTPATKRDIPGDSVDGYAREYVCMPAHAFTKAPAGYTHVEAATLTCAGVTAWRGLAVCGQVKPGDTVLILGSGGVSLKGTGPSPGSRRSRPVCV